MTPLRIFIGYDPREAVAYHVLAHSILTRARHPVTIAPLALSQLQGLYTRPRDPLASTDFSLTRFLVPHLCDYQGYAIFLDCDMLCQVDLGDIFLPVLANPGKTVYVCPHDYVPKARTKFLGQTQTTYPMKNWSSLMVFDCQHCRALTPEYVNTATPEMLHRFWWTTNDAIGSLPLTWNWLVGEYAPKPDAQILHYTNGGPWFAESIECDHADLWREECDRMMTVTEGVLA